MLSIHRSLGFPQKHLISFGEGELFVFNQYEINKKGNSPKELSTRFCLTGSSPMSFCHWFWAQGVEIYATNICNVPCYQILRIKTSCLRKQVLYRKGFKETLGGLSSGSPGMASLTLSLTLAITEISPPQIMLYVQLGSSQECKIAQSSHISLSNSQVQKA